MGLYIRGNRYYFKKQLEGKVYYKALKLKRGQENLLSARLKQIEDQITAEHYGIPYNPNKQINFLDYCNKYFESKKYKKTKMLSSTLFQRLNISAGFILKTVRSKRYVLTQSLSQYFKK